VDDGQVMRSLSIKLAKANEERVGVNQNAELLATNFWFLWQPSDLFAD
jgi:hypothetical protein